MKKSIFILLAAILLVSFSMSARDDNRTSLQYNKSMSKMECQQFLECFCIKYYNGMFDRYYHKNSLVVDYVKKCSDNYGATWTEIQGRHSFKNSSTHNDCTIKAKVRELDYNKYEVTVSVQMYVGPVPVYWSSGTRVFNY